MGFLKIFGLTTTADSRRERRAAERAIEKKYQEKEERRLQQEEMKRREEETKRREKETKRREENMAKMLKDLQKDKQKEIEGENLLRL